MSIYDLLSDAAWASLLILLAQFIRAKVKFFQQFFVPASLLAGFMGLLLGNQFLNVLNFSPISGQYAGCLIILVFTVVGINGFELKKGEGALVARRYFGFAMLRNVAFFLQFALGIAATLTIVKLVKPDINPGFGILMASGFTGGHGTAAAVGRTFTELGWTDGADLGMTFATAGILVGIFGGLAFIKIATKLNWTAYIKDFNYISGDLRTGLIAKENRKPLGMETISSVSLDGLGFQFALVVMVAGFGYLLNAKILAPYLIKGIPDFTVSYLVGLLFFLIFRKTPVYDYVDKNITSRISGTATDFLVFFGVAKINIQIIIEYAMPLLILIMVGILCTFVVMVPFGFLMNDKSWFERAIFIFGYSTGVFAIGFVLLRIVDPDNLSHTVDDTAMSPWLSFVEIFCWSLVPTMLLAGDGWTVVWVCSALTVFSIVASVMVKSWFPKSPAGRGGWLAGE